MNRRTFFAATLAVAVAPALCPASSPEEALTGEARIRAVNQIYLRHGVMSQNSLPYDAALEDHERLAQEIAARTDDTIARCFPSYSRAPLRTAA